MAYINFPSPTPIFPVLPPLAWSVHKKPLMASRSVLAASGREVKLACGVYPRWAFTLTYGGDSWLRDQTQNIVPDATLAGLTELEQLAGLFVACRGAYGEFYYSDPDDNSRSAALLGYGDGRTLSFPLMVPWGNGPFSPGFSYPAGGVASLDAVYTGGLEVPSSIYSLVVNSSGCYVVFNANNAPTDAVTADFHFYFRCRFLDDTMSYSQFIRNLWQVKEVRFESVKP